MVNDPGLVGRVGELQASLLESQKQLVVQVIRQLTTRDTEVEISERGQRDICRLEWQAVGVVIGRSRGKGRDELVQTRFDDQIAELAADRKVIFGDLPMPGKRQLRLGRGRVGVLDLSGAVDQIAIGPGRDEPEIEVGERADLGRVGVQGDLDLTTIDGPLGEHGPTVLLECEVLPVPAASGVPSQPQAGFVQRDFLDQQLLTPRQCLSVDGNDDPGN